MSRRQVLAVGCAHCAAWPRAWSAGDDWSLPERFARPDLATDEGGLWAIMEREEARLRRSPFLIRDAGLREYVQGIACRLGGAHCPDIRVHLVRTPYFNASMAPNGMMQVWSGLLLRVENEAQLAAVMGHELGHYLQRHMLERLQDVKAKSAFGLFMAPFGAAGLVGQLIAAASAMAFSRDQERAADSIGVTLMRHAGYDPREASKVWTNLLAELEAAPGGDPSKSNPLFATHPSSMERGATLANLTVGDKGGFVGDSVYTDKLAALQYDLLDDEVKRGQRAETLALLDRMVGRAPGRADLLYFRGETRRLRGISDDMDLARADFQRAIDLGNEPAQVYRAIGYLERKRGHLGEARAAFMRYLERAPDAPDVKLIRDHLNDSEG